MFSYGSRSKDPGSLPVGSLPLWKGIKKPAVFSRRTTTVYRVRDRSRLGRYSVATVATALPLALWLLPQHPLEPAPFTLLTAAVAVSVWYGGLGPGLLSAFAGALASLYLLLPPRYSLAGDAEQSALQFFVFLLVTFLITTLHVSQDQAEKELSRLALHDPLTDLPNRSLFDDRLHQAILAADRERSSLALLLLDLDGFKEVNDSLGHKSGDLLLQQVSTRLKERVRESDTVARLGGDEFAVILPGSSEEDAEQSAGKIWKALERGFQIGAEFTTVRGSIGISLYPANGPDAASLLHQADVAMYASKRAGGGYAIFHGDEPMASDSGANPQEGEFATDVESEGLTFLRSLEPAVIGGGQRQPGPPESSS